MRTPSAVLASAALIATLVIHVPSARAATPPPGPWRAPVAGVTVLAAFDPPAKRWLAGHRGVDLAASVGSPVTAAGPGIVTFAATIADRGVVVVSHGALRTTYEPVDASVGPGTPVIAGEQIGRIGGGGHCSERCLHWGAILTDVYVDPMLLLGRYRPVLKPPLL